MKKILLMTAILAMAAACTGKKAPKTLVLYYSQTGMTKAVAEQFQKLLGADIEEIVAENPYDGDFQATIDRCRKEMEGNVTPGIKPIQADLKSYDIIFLGYPIWFGTYAPPVKAVLGEAGLTGGKIVPFCTFGSGGLESSIKDLQENLPDSEILPGYGVRAARIDAAPAEVENFLKAGGFIKGEYKAPEEFSATHPVTEEETAIFTAAVGNYPMLKAKPSEVSSRKVPEGVEYLFTALDTPWEPTPESSFVEVKVYVLAENGKDPVFTRVVR